MTESNKKDERQISFWPGPLSSLAGSHLLSSFCLQSSLHCGVLVTTSNGQSAGTLVQHFTIGFAYDTNVTLDIKWPNSTENVCRRVNNILNRSLKYEESDILFSQPIVVLNLYEILSFFLSYLEHKRRFSEACSCCSVTYNKSWWGPEAPEQLLVLIKTIKIVFGHLNQAKIKQY